MTDDRRAICIELAGELDVTQRALLTEAFAVPDEATLAIVDLARVTYLDSSALGALVGLRQRVAGRAGGAVVLAGAGAHVKRILEITGLEELFAHFDSADAALAALAVTGSIDRKRFAAGAEPA